MKFNPCTCHGKYPRWWSSGECEITVRKILAKEQANKKKEKTPIKRTPLKKKFYVLKKVSSKQKVRNKKYAGKKKEKYYDEWVDGGYIACAIRTDKCENVAVDDHHVDGRGGEDLYGETIPACRPCHDWCKTHPKEAEEAGFIRSRLKTN